MLDKERLNKLYIGQGKSKQEIAKLLNCSLHKVSYWMEKHAIKTRSISDAIYLKHNPNGDPFKFKKPKNINEAVLYGLGLGLYWGEGTKADSHSVRLGNTDPKLLKRFVEFLIRFFGINKQRLRFGLQIFTDISIEEAIDFWVKELKIKRHQVYKPIITLSGSLGTYRKKSRYGVLTVIFSNTKLRNLLVEMLPK